MTLQVAIQQCPSNTLSSFPYFSLSCSGHLCTDLLSPCSSNSDCIYSNCTALGFTNYTSVISQVNRAVGNFFDQVSLFPNSEQSSTTCSAYTYNNIGLTTLNRLMSSLRSLLGATSATSGQLQFQYCGIDHFIAGKVQVPHLLAINFNEQFLSTYTNWAQDYSYIGIPSLVGQYLISLPLNYITGWLIKAAAIVVDLVTPIANAFTQYVYTSGGRLTVVGFSTWDGTLDDSSNVFNQNRKSGSSWTNIAPNNISALDSTDANIVNLLYTTCDLQVSFFPQQSLGLNFKLPNGQGLTNVLTGLLNDIRSCRNPSNSYPSNTDAQTFFNPLSLEFYLNLVTQTTGEHSAPAALSIPTLSSWANNSLGVPRKSLLIPPSCSYNTYIATGQCVLSWTGLNTLFPGIPNADLSIRGTVTRCDLNADSLPSLNIQCTGKDCNQLLSLSDQLLFCQADSDCPTTSNGITRKCNILSNGLLPTPFSSYFWNSPASSSSEYCDSSNQNVVELYNMYRRYFALSTISYNNVTMGPTGLGVGYCDIIWQATITKTPSNWVTSLYNSSYNNTYIVSGLANYTLPAANKKNGADSRMSSIVPLSIYVIGTLCIAVSALFF